LPCGKYLPCVLLFPDGKAGFAVQAAHGNDPVDGSGIFSGSEYFQQVRKEV
jgi:hypothetical protein